MSENDKKNKSKTKPRKGSRANAKTSTKKAAGEGSSRKRAAEGKAAKRAGDTKRSGKREERSKARAQEEKGRSFPVWLFILLGAVLLLAFAVWSYYPVAKQQYIASREKERLQAELAIIEKRNSQLQSEIDRLNTDEGIEDYARNELGWVKEGENSVIVEGLDSGARSSTGVDWRVDPKEIKLKNTPWTRFLDMIFKIESE